MSSLVPEDALRPRLCHLKKVSNFQGYGFNLHAEKGKAGQYIGKVDDGSPAETAGLKSGDRIVEVNGTNIGNENHQQVVQRIKAVPDETKLLVVDNEADQYYKDKKIVVRGDMPGVMLGGTDRLTTEEALATQTITAQMNHEPPPPTVNGDVHVSHEDMKTEEVAAVAAVAAIAIEEEKKQENQQAEPAQVVVNGETGPEVTVVTQDGGEVSHVYIEAESPPPPEPELPPPPPPTYEYEQEEVTVTAEEPAVHVVTDNDLEAAIAVTTVTTTETTEAKADGEVVTVEKTVESVSTDQGTVQVETTTVKSESSPAETANETTTVVTTTETVAAVAEPEPEVKVESTSAETEAAVVVAAVTTAAAVDASSPPPAEPTPLAQPESPKPRDPNDPFGVSAAEMRERLKGRRTKKQEVKSANLSTIDKYQMYQRL